MIRHLPPQDMLVDYASGALPQPVAMAVATHAQLCDESRNRITALEEVGGAMLMDLAPEVMSSGALDAVLDRLDELPDTDDPVDDGAVVGASLAGDLEDLLPADLRVRLVRDANGIRWRHKGGAVESAEISSDVDGFDVRLLRIKAGKAVPQHTHEGLEITLCLTGSYRDGDERFAKGDFQVADPSVDHRPVADADEDCIVLAVVEQRIRLTGLFGRVVNPFVRL